MTLERMSAALNAEILEGRRRGDSLAGLEGHKEQAGGLRGSIISSVSSPYTGGVLLRDRRAGARCTRAALGAWRPTAYPIRSFDVQPEEVGYDLGFRRIGGKAVSHKDDMFFPNSYLVSSTRTLKKRKALRLKSIKGVQFVSSNRAFPRIV